MTAPDTLDFARFRDTLAGVFDVAATPADRADFRSKVRFRATRRFALGELEASPARYRRTTSAPIDAAVIVCVRRGELELRVGATSRRLGEGGLFFLDLSESFEFRPLGPIGLAMLWSNRLAWSERLVAESIWHGLTLDPATASAAVCGAALEGFALAVGRTGVAEANGLAEGLLDLAAKAANAKLSPRGRPMAADPRATLAKVRRFVDRNLSSPKLDLPMIARAFGVSRASLYRLFAPIGGVATYIRKARLEHARRALASSQLADRRIGDVAHVAGFRSVGVFNRLFLAEYGLTPSQARALALQEGEGAAPCLADYAGDLAARLRDLV